MGEQELATTFGWYSSGDSNEQNGSVIGDFRQRRGDSHWVIRETARIEQPDFGVRVLFLFLFFVALRTEPCASHMHRKSLPWSHNPSPFCFILGQDLSKLSRLALKLQSFCLSFYSRKYYRHLLPCSAKSESSELHLNFVVAWLCDPEQVPCPSKTLFPNL